MQTEPTKTAGSDVVTAADPVEPWTSTDGVMRSVVLGGAPVSAGIEAESVQEEQVADEPEPEPVHGAVVVVDNRVPVREAGPDLDETVPLAVEVAAHDRSPGPDPDGAAARLPLLTPEIVNGFLARWSEIQIGFVEDPPRAVHNAENLVDEIADALAAAMAQRRGILAAQRGQGDPDTEELRLALRRYRSFISVLLPRTHHTGL